MPTLRLSTTGSTYPITIAHGLLNRLPSLLRALKLPRSSRFFLVTSDAIWQLWSETVIRAFAPGPSPPVLLLPAGEPHKRLRTVETLAEQLAAHRADRDTVLIAFGGGIVGDVTGFLAAIYMRGVPYIQVPTTLLAQVDSSIGGKTGVNLAAGKNLVGSFHQPLAVFTDPELTRTLAARELRAGMQEAIKAGLLGDARLFTLLERNADILLDPEVPGHAGSLTRVITAAARVKAAIVAADEREAGRRMLLNLGHTLGHAIESVTRYRALLHGEAIAWGMIAALHLAQARGRLAADRAARAQQLILRFGPLPRFRATAAELVAAAAGDKKVRGGALSFVLPVDLGRAEIVRDVGEPELLAAAESMLQRMRTLTPSPARPLREDRP